MAAQFVTHEEFDEHKQFVSKYLDNIDRRLNTIENTQSQQSVRLSGIETRLEMLELDVKAGFARVDAQMKEIRHMLGFLITHMGLILPAQPES